MNIIISNASDKPIYDQIYHQIKTAILSGELAPGQALPSIRALAKDLRVSVITTKRARLATFARLERSWRFPWANSTRPELKSGGSEGSLGAGRT